MKATINPTGGISLFDVGGIKRKKKDKTNTITTDSTGKSKTEKEQKHKGGNTAMTSGSVDLMEQQDWNMESEETEETRAELAKKRV